MAKPALVTTQPRQSLPILIIDKSGTFACALGERVMRELMVVSVTQPQVLQGNNCIWVPFTHRIPRYSG